MTHRFLRSCAAGLLVAGLLTGVARRADAQTPRIAAVVVNPSSATLTVGQSTVIKAEARTAAGVVVPGVAFTFKPNRAGRVLVETLGPDQVRLTGQTLGVISISVKGGKKSTLLPVSVVGAPRGGGSFVASQTATVNHAVTDGAFVYWTEVGTSTVKIRRAPVTGGGAEDLVTEPARDRRSLRVSYAHIRLNSGRLYFSRQTVGFLEHWSIRSIPLGGGPVNEELAEDISVVPMLAHTWSVTDTHLAAILARPEELTLSADTRVAVRELGTDDWRSAVQARYLPKQCSIVATDGADFFVRGIDSAASKTELVRVDPTAPVNTFQFLFTDAFVDKNIPNTGAFDGANVYFWSRIGTSDNSIRAFPVAGGLPFTLVTLDRVGAGLVSDGASVYFARDPGTLSKVPVGGGTATNIRTGIEAGATLGGLSIDLTSIYLVIKDATRTFAVIRSAR